ncbi:MAG: hypothetical protein MJ078_07010, partial [Clostridia bacterium]|nr:hypothetical protein [Clostridia bacterium]
MVAALRLLDAPFRADKEYGYLVPDSLVPDVFPGRICVVPFGKGNKPVYGVVTQTKDLPSEEESVHPYKTIQAVLSPHFALTEEILKLCFFLREHTLCSVGEALRSAMPVSALGLLEERYKLSPSAPALPLNGRENDVFRFLTEFPEGKTLKEIGEVFGDSGQRLCKTLLKKGLVVSETRLAKEPLKTVKLYSVSSPAEAGELLTRPGV